VNFVKGYWCQYCANKKLCDDEKCIECFNKSFASQPKSKYWSDKNILSTRQVFKSSNEKYIFDCKCGHEFETILSNVFGGSWCPFCCEPPIKLCDDLNCEQCHQKSVAPHPKSKYWSKNNTNKPRDVFKNSNNKYEFKCAHDHVFLMNPNKIVTFNQWCPFCKNKTEAKLFKWLVKCGHKITYQAKYEWCKNKNCFPFDFSIEKFKIIIELDGAQHFKQISNWASPVDTQKTDLFKIKKAIKNDYTVIRLLQDDVWNDKYNWKKKLNKYIHIYDVSQCIYLSEGNEYKCFEEK
jgi:very-short-patch-repair endonuclease